MNAQGAKHVRYDSGPNMTPLVDVVMVILIFLMLAGSFGGASHFLMSKQGIERKGQSHALSHVDVADVDLDIHVDNARDGAGFVAQGPGFNATSDVEKLKADLTLRRQQFNSAGTPTSDLKVVLHPARRVQYQYLIAVYEAALRAKFEKVTFAMSP